jgi:hypothetical protein
MINTVPSQDSLSGGKGGSIHLAIIVIDHLAIQFIFTIVLILVWILLSLLSPPHSKPPLVSHLHANRHPRQSTPVTKRFGKSPSRNQTQDSSKVGS